VNYTETAWYSGLLTLPLALLGLFARPRRPAAFFATVTSIGVLATLGTFFYRLVLLAPGFDRTVHVSRFILFVGFGLAGLAALGLHSLLDRRVRRSPWVVAVPVASLVGVLLLLTIDHDGTPLPWSYVRRGGVRGLALAIAGGLLLVAMARFRSRSRPIALAAVGVLAVDLWLFAFPLNPYHDPRPVYARTKEIDLIATAPGERPRFSNVAPWWVPLNAALAHNLYGIEGYDPFIPRRFVELVAIAEDQTQNTTFNINIIGPFREESFRSPIFDLLGVRTVTGPPSAFSGTTPRHVGQFALFDRPTAFPPAFLTSCWEARPGAGGLDRLRTMSADDLRSTVVLDRAPTGGPTAAPPSACGPAGEATLRRYEPERVVIDATADRASMLVLTDSWYPGWEATVDGKKVEVLRADHALRAVALPPGTHRVEFNFRPRSLRVGASITTTALVAVAALGLVPTWLRRRRRPRTTA
jgi:hypothetical protein